MAAVGQKRWEPVRGSPPARHPAPSREWPGLHRLNLVDNKTVENEFGVNRITPSRFHVAPRVSDGASVSVLARTAGQLGDPQLPLARRSPATGCRATRTDGKRVFRTGRSRASRESTGRTQSPGRPPRCSATNATVGPSGDIVTCAETTDERAGPRTFRPGGRQGLERRDTSGAASRECGIQPGAIAATATIETAVAVRTRVRPLRTGFISERASTPSRIHCRL